MNEIASESEFVITEKHFKTDRGIGNEYSDEDEEQEFSSNDDDGLSGYAAKRNYASKRDNYRKLERNENDAEADENLGGAQGDSDSDFEVKVKGSRANKMSRVSVANLIVARFPFHSNLNSFAATKLQAENCRAAQTFPPGRARG